MMRDDDLHASTLLRNNESAVIAWAKNSRLVVVFNTGRIQGAVTRPYGYTITRFIITEDRSSAG